MRLFRKSITIVGGASPTIAGLAVTVGFLYVGSVGPIAQLVIARRIPQQCEYLYRPLERFADLIPGGDGLLVDYIAWCGPKGPR